MTKMAAGRTVLQINPNKKVLFGRNRAPHKILVSSIETPLVPHWRHLEAEFGMQWQIQSIWFRGNDQTKPLHWTSRCSGHPSCSVPDSSYSLPSSRSSNITGAWGKNSLALRKPTMSILCLSWPRPYSNRILGKSSFLWESGKDCWGQTCTNTKYS